VGVPSALLVPLAYAQRHIGLLAIGFLGTRQPTWNEASAEVADAFVTTLELFRLRRREELQADIQELLAAFAHNLSSTFNMATSLEAFCQAAKWLFGAERMSVWMHDRHARQLALLASSDPEHLAHGPRLPADDPSTPASSAMRRARAEFLPTSAERPTTLTVPLRGRRRALGLLMLEGVKGATGAELDLLDRADELGAELSGAIENMQLLTDAIRLRREREHPRDLDGYLVAVSDAAGRLVHANAAFADRLARRPDELLGRLLQECVGPELAQWIQNPGTVNGRAPDVREIADPALKGTFLVSVASLFDQARRSVGRVVVARDLAPQSMLEAEREELRHRLTQSEKLVALGQFIAGIAHELNNPLQGVLGHLELLRTTGAFPAHLDGEVQTIYKEAERAAKIVHNLLVFTGSRRLSRRSVSLNGVLQKVVTLRKTACRAQGIEVVRHYDRRVPRVQSDPLLLHQVFLNMVMNAEQAIAATGRPGRIEISSTVSRAGDRIVATVRDTGAGIPSDALPRIFEPFYTTKEVGKGTGLGLAIVYGIVQEHGGHISAANHPEGGAVFKVELPIRPTP
jgi:signal transduction histidine kinase